jgi:hypothetical protein
LPAACPPLACFLRVARLFAVHFFLLPPNRNCLPVSASNAAGAAAAQPGDNKKESKDYLPSYLQNVALLRFPARPPARPISNSAPGHCHPVIALTPFSPSPVSSLLNLKQHGGRTAARNDANNTQILESEDALKARVPGSPISPVKSCRKARLTIFQVNVIYQRGNIYCIGTFSASKFVWRTSLHPRNGHRHLPETCRRHALILLLLFLIRKSRTPRFKVATFWLLLEFVLGPLFGHSNLA